VQHGSPCIDRRTLLVIPGRRVKHALGQAAPRSCRGAATIELLDRLAVGCALGRRRRGVTISRQRLVGHTPVGRCGRVGGAPAVVDGHNLPVWLDEDITAYHRHLAYARRLTYLALRAFEYEAQQTIGHRGETLTARRPDDLLAVVTAIEARNAPLAGELGLVVGDGKVVLSLRDEILGLFDVASSTHRLPGEPIVTPEAAFRSYLRSDSAKIFDASGGYLGQGVRFALKPGPWTEHSCAERIWRLTTSLQIDNPPTQHAMVLYQDNAFGSQDCRAAFGDVIASRAESSTNVLTGDTSAFTPPVSVTAVNVDGPLGLDHETLRNRPVGDIAGLAGRGLYGNYILLFPKETWPAAQIAKVKDVLFRFDTVELTRP